MHRGCADKRQQAVLAIISTFRGFSAEWGRQEYTYTAAHGPRYKSNDTRAMITER